jgi:shikimate dehydrogenase
MNVTVPHKQAVMPFLTGISPEALAVGAVNTLVRTEEGYEGYNTDVLGLSENIASEGVSLTGRKVVLIGAGGAARAAAWLCGRDRAEKLYIANRTPANAKKLKEEAERSWPDLPVEVISLSDLASPGERDLIAIQCTSVGLYPESGRAPVTDPVFYGRLTHAFDTIYRPEKTLFMKLSEEQGAKTANGLGMLVWQGLRSYEIWTGIRADKDQALRVRSRLEALLKEEE